jgi:hypothetical protein
MESYGIQSRKSTLTLLMGQRINMLASSKAGDGARGRTQITFISN